MQYNKVLIIGNLTRDPELRYVQSGRPVCKFGLATNRRFKKADGEMGEETCFVDVTVWGRQAETVNEYLRRGAGAFVEGRLAFETWETEGQKRSKHTIVADRVQFLPRGGGGGGGGGGRREEDTTDFGDRYQQYEAPGAEPSDPDVPF